MHLIMIFTF